MTRSVTSTHIDDGAQQTVFFSNQFVDPGTDYAYDAIYRLIEAHGREHIGQVAAPQTTYDDLPRMNQPLPNDRQAMRRYTETYQYDAVGNILSLAHAAPQVGAVPAGNWTRSYAYDEPNPQPANNRLTSTTVGQTEIPYGYDPHGNVVAMPHLSLMAWDFKDQLQATQQRVASRPVETTYYVYNAGGQRTRKVTETAGGNKAKERIYLGGFEVYREYDATGSTVMLERNTLHVMDDKRRIALIETKTIDATVPAGSLPSDTIRYQFDNHLGSACLELDQNAAIISYEEYYPYGSTSYQAGANAAEVSLKRYRCTGKERDEENRFYYHGARYYAPWLGRWTSCDPSGMADGPNLYAYAQNSPLVRIDPNGTDSTTTVSPKQQLASLIERMGGISYDVTKVSESELLTKYRELQAQGYSKPPSTELAGYEKTPKDKQVEGRVIVVLDPSGEGTRNEYLRLPNAQLDEAEKQGLASAGTAAVVGLAASIAGVGAGKAAFDATRYSPENNPGQALSAAHAPPAQPEEPPLARAEHGAAAASPEFKTPAAKSSSLGPGNRLPLVELTLEPIKPHGEVLQGAVARIVARLEANPELGGNFLSSRRIDALAEAVAEAKAGDPRQLNRLAPLAFGQAVEKAATKLGNETGLMRSIGQARVAGKFTASTDFEGLGSWAGNRFEITTKNALAAHAIREYGMEVDVHYALYSVPPSWVQHLLK